ncbi:MAG TPA: hypothetical protein VNZ49_00075 [Bacteroidia bacterium]|jgi:hypothetical protein|nr:hypothetical protein [Bacteroidia bacterium]
MKKLVLIFFLFNLPGLIAQSVYAPLNSDYSYLLDRYEIKSNNNAGNRIFSSVKPCLRKDIAQLADTLLQDSSALFSRVDKFNLQYLQNDNWDYSKSERAGNTEKRFLKIFYEKRNALYQFRNKDFEVQFNPVVYASYGKEQGSSNTEYVNTRGIELRGAINKKIGFYTFMTDNQAVFPLYVQTKIDSLQAVPGEGFWKTFKKDGVDFFTAKGYFTFNICKSINVQFGHDKNFIGNGYRSLFLSDFSSNYLFLKINTNVWKFQYTNIFAKLNPFNGNDNALYHPNKYMALHYLSLNLTKKFTIGLFESITFGNTDSVQNRRFELNYLNPVIFYKSIEDNSGSPDKAHVGFDLKWNFLKHFSFYSQLFIDEFIFEEAVTKNKGWWGNKQALQVGLKYIDVFGVRNLDIQLEVNAVRPYTYTHFSFSKYTNYSNFTNYTNYQQPLAHPLGANFYEYIGILRYQPFKRISLTAKMFYTVIGLDDPGKNWGSNIFLDYTTRQKEYGNALAQGIKTNIIYTDFTVSCHMKHNLFLDFKVIIRKQISESVLLNNNTNFLSAAFRWNIPQRMNEY